MASQGKFVPIKINSTPPKCGFLFPKELYEGLEYFIPESDTFSPELQEELIENIKQSISKKEGTNMHCISPYFLMFLFKIIQKIRRPELKNRGSYDLRNADKFLDLTFLDSLIDRTMLLELPLFEYEILGKPTKFIESLLKLGMSLANDFGNWNLSISNQEKTRYKNAATKRTSKYLPVKNLAQKMAEKILSSESEGKITKKNVTQAIHDHIKEFSDLGDNKQLPVLKCFSNRAPSIKTITQWISEIPTKSSMRGHIVSFNKTLELLQQQFPHRKIEIILLNKINM